MESAFQNRPAMAVGEVIGSNIFDLLLVVGMMGLIRPWKVSEVMRTQDLPILLIASTALWVAGDTVLFDGMPHNTVDRSSGLMLIMVFIFYMWFMILSSRKEKNTAAAASSVGMDTSTPSPESEQTGIVYAHNLKSEIIAVKHGLTELRSRHWFSWIMIAAGLTALVIGGNWVVDGASGLALKIGMSQGMVALTVVAIGNALPDLVTSVTATVKGASGIALGNIVGSCIINALLSVGVSALVIPLKADTIGFVDFFTLVGASALIWIVPLVTKEKKIGRLFGTVLVALYVAYMVFTVVRG